MYFKGNLLPWFSVPRPLPPPFPLLSLSRSLFLSLPLSVPRTDSLDSSFHRAAVYICARIDRDITQVRVT